MFVEKTQKELEALSADQLQAYFLEKYEAEKKELAEKVKALEEKVNDETLSARVKELEKENVASLKQAFEAQGKVLKGLQEKQFSAREALGIEGMVKSLVADHAEDFAKASKSRHEFGMTLKVAGDMTFGGNVTGTVPQATRLPGVNDIAERMPKTYGMIPKLVVDGNTVEWVYETNQDGTIDGTAEGTVKDQIDNDFVVSSVSLVKRAAYFKVSTEMLTDATFMEGWLRNKLIIRLFLDVDNQCLNGDGTAPNLNGVINQSTAFAAGSFAGTIDNANEADVLVVAMTNIKVANQDVSNLAVQMNPVDVAALKMVKLSATDKRYVDRLLMVGSTLTIDGTPIIENNNIAAGTYLVGDFNKATIVEKSSISVELGLDANDFTRNMRTLLAEWRGQLFIQENDTTAFVTGTFATDKAALETP